MSFLKLIQCLPKTQSVLNLNIKAFSPLIQIPCGTLIPESDLVKGLTALSRSHSICTVDLSGHTELTDLSFSRFRKLLPTLKKVQLFQIEPEECEIGVTEFVKYYARGIQVEMDPELTQRFQVDVGKYLEQNGQKEYAASQEFIHNRNAWQGEPFQRALQTAEARAQREIDDLIAMQNRRKAEAEQEWKTLQQQWLNKDSNVFDLSSPWVQNGPTSKDSFPNSIMSEELFALYLLITKHRLWEQLKQGPGALGYMFSTPKSLQFLETHPVTYKFGHSGASFACAMRVMERIAVEGKLPVDVSDSRKRAPSTDRKCPASNKKQK
jgi:hypothetical protein